MSGPKSILVYVGLDLMGDGLMKLPFVRALRAAFPDAHVTWLAGKGKSAFSGRLAPLVDGLIDEVIDQADIGQSIRREWGRRPLGGRSFDLILDTQRRFKTTLLLRRIRHKTFISPSTGYLLSDVRPKGRADKPPALVAQLLQLVSLAVDGTLSHPLRTDGVLPGLDPLVEKAKPLLPDDRPTVALAPGAGGRHKCWPLDKFAELGNRLAERGTAPAFILGPDETEWRAPLAQACPAALFPLESAAPELLAREPMLTIAIAANCAATVANDAGIGHMFAAAGVPLVSLFGPTPPDKFAPTARTLRILRAQDFGGTDMNAIPVEAVFEAVSELTTAT